LRNDEFPTVSDADKFATYLTTEFDDLADTPSINVRRDVEQMLARIVDAALDNDLAKTAKFYSFPVGFVRPTGFKLLHSVEELCEETGPAFSAYRAQGVRAITNDLLQLCSYSPVMARAEVRWDHLDRKGAVLRSLYSTLIMRWQGDRYRIVLHMVHNEFLEPHTSATM